MTAGLVLQSFGFGWIAFEASPTVDYVGVITPLLLAGVGISMVLPTAPMAALGAVEPQDMGKASDVTNTLQRFGGAFGVAIASVVFVGNGNRESAASFAAGYRPALAVSAMFSLLGAVVALGVARRSGLPRSVRRAADESAIGTPK